MRIADVENEGRQIIENVERVIVGKTEKIELVLAAILAGGHVLLEDVPGTGKTMLAKAIAKSINASCMRIQFTPDLLPSDLLGLNFYNPKTGEFTFRQGAVFTNILLADEINRATPRTQSSLLESMEEKQITIDGTTYILELPFFVIATQNPVETHGTYPLPEAQLDRFLLRLSMGYPSQDESVSVLKRFLSRNPIETLSSVCSKKTLVAMIETVKTVQVSDEVAKYVIQIAENTRQNNAVALGVSTRGALALVKAAQALAAIRGQEFVTPDYIKHLIPYVFGHRIIMKSGMKNREEGVREAIDEALSLTVVPTEDFHFNQR